MLKLYTKAKIAMMTKRDRGVTAAEYGMILALIAAVIIGAVVILGGKINTAFQNINSKMQ